MKWEQERGGWLGGEKRQVSMNKTENVRIGVGGWCRFEMYVTRLLSHIQRSPESLSLPPDGPNSGYLVIQDKESKTTPFFEFLNVQDLPLPQNKKLHVNYLSDDEETTFVPVVNKPLSSNLYYALKPHGSRKGESYACSKEEDMSSSCCWGNSIQDVEPRPIDPNDIYQQFHIIPYERSLNNGGAFSATSIAPDGFPPHLLRREGCSEAIIVGKWYCPFMFIKNGTLRDWMKRSMFYEMILEQRWEQIFCCENDYSKGNVVSLDVAVQTEMVIMAGRNAVWDENSVTNGVIWFTSLVGVGEEVNIGLSSLIVDRMKWEQERGGWISSQKRQARVNKTEEYAGIGVGGWSRFGCYVLVERFVLKRMDGSVALTYDFKHTHVIRSKWEGKVFGTLRNFNYPNFVCISTV
ncbi:unnamed protein product [Camellia sinensis]